MRSSDSERNVMTAYAMAHLHHVDVNEEISEYLACIDETLPPFGGRFLVHNRTPEVVDGAFPGVIVVIEFPDLERARAWYSSPGYQAIVDLRISNSVGGAFLVDGVPEGYLASSLLANVG